MHLLRIEFDAEGNVIGVEMVGEPQPVQEFSDEFLHHSGAPWAKRHGDLLTITCDNGQWVYRITDYDLMTKAWWGELVSATRHVPSA